MEDFTKIYSSNDPVKAKLIQGLLEKNGMEAHILDRKDSAYVMLGEVAVFVPAKDADKALEILDEVDFELDEDDEDYD
ncbi:MAG: DUF2007 domain-containing protein [Saprospirales bacterium]|jgi:hypothetical protein|nr:MAG: DUF2007 domain-containing protein [Saprospirales bacterium]